MKSFLKQLFAFHMIMWYILMAGTWIRFGWDGVWFAIIATIVMNERIAFAIRQQEKKNDYTDSKNHTGRD